MTYKKILIILFFIIVSPANANNYDIERSKYVKAIKYYKNKNYKKFEIIKKELINYPLYAELEYKSIHRKKNINNTEVIRFIKKYKKSYLSEKAYINLIYRLSAKNKMDMLISNYVDIGSVDLSCLYIRAKIKKKYFSNIDAEIIPIWLSSKSQPKSCDFVFKWFYKNKKLSDELVWQRINMALNANNYYLARYLKRFLSNKNKQWAKILLKVHVNPKKNILSSNLKKDSRYRNTILSYALDKIAKKDFVSAKQYLYRIKNEYKVTDKFFNKKMLEIFIIALKSNQQNITYDKDFSLTKNNSNLAFTIAFANYSIFNTDWKNLLKSIEKMPQNISQEEKWLYWKGKALYKIGDRNLSKNTLEDISSRRSYYGFLASNILDKQISIINIPYNTNLSKLKKIKESYEIKRLYELYILGRKREARKELNFILKDTDNDTLNNMSVLFKNWGWNVGSILGYGKTKYFDDVDARFPIMHEKYFNEYSKTNLQKSLLLGIARKESIFIQYAKSSAGALGIMQIMPKTAFWVLKRTKSKKVSKNYLYNKKMNIFIGSYYFNYLLSKRKSYVESIASYNAGPNSVSKWRKLNKAPEDSWIEFIPYRETRKYVKLVLEYTLVYDWILNKKNTIRVSQLININK